MSHAYTAETIYHFTCGQCGNWWSYAHHQVKYALKLPDALSTLSCPHCGYTDEVNLKPTGTYPDSLAMFRDRPA
jgi:predicted RNA-binding Zn-ribbon protein involved in translation (DUF1610 family)